MRDTSGGKVYRRLPFNSVSYDGSPDGVIEPINHEQSFSGDGDGQGYLLNNAATLGSGLVNKFEFVTGNPFPAEIMSFE